MERFEAIVVINRSAEEIGEWLDNVDNWAVWQSALIDAEKTSEGPMGVGSTFRGTSHFLGRQIGWTSEYLEYTPMSSRLKILAGPITIDQTMTFKPVEGGTKVTLVGEGESGGFFRLAEPLVARMYARDMQANLERLKDILEAQE